MTIEASQFRSAMDFTNRVQSGKIKLPVSVSIGNSTFGLSEKNIDDFVLGVLFASDEAWDKVAEKINEEYLK